MYKQRIKIFLTIIGLVLAGLLGRLAHLQLVRGEEYRQVARRAIQRVEALPAGRGQILDRHGNILAIDQPCFDLSLDFGLLSDDAGWTRRQMQDLAGEMGVSLREADWREQVRPVFDARRDATWQLVRDIGLLVDQDADETASGTVRRVMGWARRAGTRVEEQNQAHPIVTGLDNALAARAREMLPRTIGLHVQPSHRRWYPYGRLACHIIGTTGPVTREEMLARNLTADQAGRIERLLHNYMPWDTLGKAGVERLAEETLRGERGYRRVQMGGTILQEQTAHFGGDVYLSIDIHLQRHLTELLEQAELTGAIAMLDVATGQILALVSVPTYDLNRYRQDYAGLVGDEVYLPLLHRAVAALYAPGSTSKPITALAGLATGVITPHSHLSCSPGFIGNNPNAFRCWIYRRHGQTHGDLNLFEALRKSCNVYFFRLADRIGTQRLVEWFELWGYADRPGTGLPEERAGELLTPQTLRRKFERGQRHTASYTPADGWLLSIGQGDIAVTVLHVANGMGAIARDGTLLHPVLFPDAPPEEPRSLPVPESSLRDVRRAMWEVCNDRSGGTAWRYFNGSDVQRLGFDVAGKTGTAETPPQRVDGEIVRSGNTAWFAGFAPHDRPRVAFAVMVEYSDDGGGTAGAPLAREALRRAHELGYID